MTKAAGTLQWMLPEIFRGDQNYTKSLDVYSLGIVLWELATRKTPWVDELSAETEFFGELNFALQTGRRPAIPHVVLAEHGAFVAVMQKCWADDPVKRPGQLVFPRQRAISSQLLSLFRRQCMHRQLAS